MREERRRIAIGVDRATTVEPLRGRVGLGIGRSQELVLVVEDSAEV